MRAGRAHGRLLLVWGMEITPPGDGRLAHLNPNPLSAPSPYIPSKSMYNSRIRNLLGQPRTRRTRGRRTSWPAATGADPEKKPPIELHLTQWYRMVLIRSDRRRALHPQSILIHTTACVRGPMQPTRVPCHAITFCPIHPRPISAHPKPTQPTPLESDPMRFRGGGGNVHEMAT